MKKDGNYLKRLRKPMVERHVSFDGEVIDRGLVFNYEQAQLGFRTAYSSDLSILCVDGAVSKWCFSLFEAHQFYNPGLKYECECGWWAQWLIEDFKEDITCYDCGKKIENYIDIREERKKMSKRLFGGNE